MQDADAFKRLVLARINCSPEELRCPREKSFMTPCIARDGGLAVCETFLGGYLCVGCEHGVARLLAEERERAPRSSGAEL